MNAYIKRNHVSDIEAKLFLKEINMNHPLLQLSIPLHCINWNADNYIPSVTFLPIGFDDSENYSIKGYDNNDDLIWFNMEVEPDKTVVIICENERIEIGQKYMLPGSGGSGGGGGGGGGNNNRTDGDLEYVKNMYFSNLSAVEPWIKGKPEIRLRVFAGTGGGQLSCDFFNPNRSWVNNSWWDINHSLFYWYTGDYGNFIILKWIEEDGGATITISESYTYENTTTTVSWTQKDNDDEIGGKVVGHLDPKDATYNTGIMKWHEDF